MIYATFDMHCHLIFNTIQELKREADTLKKQLDLLQQQLEDETVIRTEIENRLKTLKEDLDFARREHMGVCFKCFYIYLKQASA